MQWLLESSDVGRPTYSKVKLCHTIIPVPSNGHPTSIRNTELKSVTHGQCNARSTVLSWSQGIAVAWLVPNYTAWWQSTCVQTTCPGLLHAQRDDWELTRRLFKSRLKHLSHYTTVAYIHMGFAADQLQKPASPLLLSLSFICFFSLHFSILIY